MNVNKQWQKFLDGGFQLHQFTNELYHLLSNNFGFVACVDRLGFYETMFGSTERTILTLRVIQSHDDPNSSEQAIKDTLNVSGALGSLLSEHNTKIEKDERIELARLLTKHAPEMYLIEAQHLEVLKLAAEQLESEGLATAAKVMDVVRYAEALRALRGPGEPYVHMAPRER